MGRSVTLAALLLIALWLRLPTVSRDLPFFYQEDEAHHFNRVAQMVKDRRFDPEYFHKPSLHFYLRMPVLAAAYLWEEAHGRIGTLSELKTRSQFGLAKYNFTASHPAIVEWNRALSVALGLLTVLFTFLIAGELGFGSKAALASAFIPAISPELIIHSGIIGVDMLMTLVCLGAVYLALRLERDFTNGGLFVLGIVCGLAVSSKYNAAPVVVLPLLLCLLKRKLDRRAMGLAIFSPVVGFLAASPYVLLRFGTFWQQLSYEVWHYGVAGHVGHEAGRGWPQVAHYFGWLTSSALGWGLTVVGLLGVAAMVLQIARSGGTAITAPQERRPPQILIFLVFPLLFFLEMVLQRANFTRNMIVIIPFFALGAAYALELITAKLPARLGLVIFLALLLLSSLAPLRLALNQRAEALAHTDTRLQALSWLSANRSDPDQEIAVNGELQLPPSFENRPSVTVFAASELEPERLYAAGFDLLITRASLLNGSPLYRVPGASEKERIVRDPEVNIFELKNFAGSGLPPTINFSEEGSCLALAAGEEYCWITQRTTLLEAPIAGAPRIALTVMSPWRGQTFTLSSGSWFSEPIKISEQELGAWVTKEIELPPALPPGPLRIEIARIHSPKSQGLSEDPRRLGLAIRRLKAIIG